MQNEPNIQKDLTLLRPFDLEKAMNGELLTNIYNDIVYKCLGYSKRERKLVIQCISSSKYDVVDIIFDINEYGLTGLRMNPLGWVENKPVYPEDVLYWNNNTYDKGTKFVAKKYFKEGAIAGYAYFPDGTKCEDENAWTKVEHLTWNKPKIKKSKKIWINIYPYSEMSISGLWHSSITGAKESAVDGCIGQKELIVEWEE